MQSSVTISPFFTTISLFLPKMVWVAIFPIAEIESKAHIFLGVLISSFFGFEISIIRTDIFEIWGCFVGAKRQSFGFLYYSKKKQKSTPTLKSLLIERVMLSKIIAFVSKFSSISTSLTFPMNLPSRKYAALLISEWGSS